jgi:hypothetical protein
LPCWLNPASKDFWEVGAWIVAIVGGLIAAYKAIQEMRLSREQRERELAWNQAREVAALLDHLDANPKAKAACLMLDWTQREYKLPSGEWVSISQEETLRALRTSDTKFTEVEAYIRDCFDAVFDYLERVNRAIEVGLVKETDLSAPLGYYVNIMARRWRVFSDFMTRYHFDGAVRFACRMPEWNRAAIGENGNEKEKRNNS